MRREFHQFPVDLEIDFGEPIAIGSYSWRTAQDTASRCRVTPFSRVPGRRVTPADWMHLEPYFAPWTFEMTSAMVRDMLSQSSTILSTVGPLSVGARVREGDGWMAQIV